VPEQGLRVGRRMDGEVLPQHQRAHFPGGDDTVAGVHRVAVKDGVLPRLRRQLPDLGSQALYRGIKLVAMSSSIFHDTLIRHSKPAQKRFPDAGPEDTAAVRAKVPTARGRAEWGSTESIESWLRWSPVRIRGHPKGSTPLPPCAARPPASLVAPAREGGVR
jgi:hypothetical protein